MGAKRRLALTPHFALDARFGTGKTNSRLNTFVAQNGLFGAPKFPAPQMFVGPFFRFLLQETRHINFFLGQRKWGFRVTFVDQVYVFFLAL